jgi:hypothetical protein
MNNGNSRRPPADSETETESPLSSVRGVVMLLGAARASAIASCGDKSCVDLIDQCIAHLSEKYDLPAIEQGANQVWTEGSVTALTRLLKYVHAEVSEILNDQPGARLLTQCIDRLLQMHFVCSQQPNAGALRGTH